MTNNKAQLKLFHEGTNVVFAHGNDRVIKIFPPFHSAQYQSEVAVLKHVQDKLSVQTPRVECFGEIAVHFYYTLKISEPKRHN